MNLWLKVAEVQLVHKHCIVLFHPGSVHIYSDLKYPFRKLCKWIIFSNAAKMTLRLQLNLSKIKALSAF